MSVDVTADPDAYGLGDEPGWQEGAPDPPVQTLQVAGCRIRYVDIEGAAAGDEPPYLLIHGAGGCWQHWLANMPRLSQERRVIALDLPGFGASPVPRRRITLGLYVKVIVGLCAELGLDQVVLIGNSLGGMVSAEVAARHPERVSELVLVDAAGISTSNPLHSARIATQLAMLQSTRLLALVSRLTGATAAAHPLTLIVAHPLRVQRGLLRAAFAPGAGKPGFGFIVLDQILSGGNRGYRGRLRKITAPTLIIWGAQDKLLPVADADVFAREISGAETAILDDTGHCPMLERPRTFNRLLEKFVHG